MNSCWEIGFLRLERSLQWEDISELAWSGSCRIGKVGKAERLHCECRQSGIVYVYVRSLHCDGILGELGDRKSQTLRGC